MKLQFNRYTRARAFRSAVDFARYAEEQKVKFDEMAQSSAANYEGWGKVAASNWGHAARSAQAAEATEVSIQEALKQSPVFAAGSALEAELRNMIAMGKRVAAEEVWPFLKDQRDRNSASNMHMIQIDAHAAFRIALAFEAAARTSKGYAPLDQVLADHESRFESLLVADQEELEAKRAAYQELMSTGETRFGELTASLQNSIQEWKATWEETHNAFVEQLATETAVKLWSGRSNAHRSRYEGLRNWSIGFGVGGLLVAMIWIFGGFALARVIFPNDAHAQIASYTAGSLALFTLLIWGLRVLIRSMMSEDHLATDASARSALAHTYLALTKEKAATPEDRAIILASLFAPVSDGLVRDDGMPAFSPTALAAQVLTNPGR